MEEKKQQILKIFPGFSFITLSDIELAHLKLDNDIIKGFQSNRKKYIDLKEKINPVDETTFLDVCHLLGLFSKGKDELEIIIYAIRYLYTNYTIDEIYGFIKQIEEIKYSEKLANILIGAIITDNLKNNISFFAAICNHFKAFSKDIEKINKNRMKMLSISGSRKPGDDIKLRALKEQGRTITLSDVIDYIKKVNLLKNRDDLKDIAKILVLETYDSEELEKIITFYEYAKEVITEEEEYFENISIPLPNGETIEWLSSIDPLNLVLGYLLKVCSTFSGTGSKIMIDGMLDNRNKHLIVRDKNGKVVAKTTCVCHDEYLFCNTLGFINEKLDTLTREEEKDYYYYYMLAVNAQLESLKLRGFDIKDIRIACEEYMVVNSIRGRENAAEFKELLSKASYYWEEFDEKLFDHRPPQYVLEIQKTS